MQFKFRNMKPNFLCRRVDKSRSLSFDDANERTAERENAREALADQASEREEGRDGTEESNGNVPFNMVVAMLVCPRGSCKREASAGGKGDKVS